jgi:hypothetical protein
MTTTMKTPKQLLFLWLLLLLVDRAVVAQEGNAVAANAEECVMGQDGSCISDGGADSLCENTHDDCDMWARIGECDANPRFMIFGCTKSCDLCDKSSDELEDIIKEKKEVLAKEEKRKEE